MKHLFKIGNLIDSTIFWKQKDCRFLFRIDEILEGIDEFPFRYSITYYHLNRKGTNIIKKGTNNPYKCSENLLLRPEFKRVDKRKFVKQIFLHEL